MRGERPRGFGRKDAAVRLTGKKYLLTLRRGGHVFYIAFDESSCPTLLDYLVDLAEDRDNPLTWQDVFTAIDTVGARLQPNCSPPTRMEI